MVGAVFDLMKQPLLVDLWYSYLVVDRAVQRVVLRRAAQSNAGDLEV
jgi:hypothetical protein